MGARAYIREVLGASDAVISEHGLEYQGEPKRNSIIPQGKRAGLPGPSADLNRPPRERDLSVSKRREISTLGLIASDIAATGRIRKVA